MQDISMKLSEDEIAFLDEDRPNSFLSQPQPFPDNDRGRMLSAISCLPVDRPPIWMMRQAGRCLPEYRGLRQKYSFRELIQSPELAMEVTLQPIRRFGFDAAILFSDILVIPEALGQGFQFRDGGGVQMDFILRDENDVARLDTVGITDRLQYVAQAIKLIKHKLHNRTALLGFSGSPWTLANFMIDGGTAGHQGKTLEMYHRQGGTYEHLAKKLTAAVTEYLQMQIDSGVDAIQIFDSLGGLLPFNDFQGASGRWMQEIIANLHGQVPIIVYSKGTRNWNGLVKTGAQAIGVDQDIALTEADENLPSEIAIQGNLNPALLVSATPREVAKETAALLNAMREREGYIFNLGHGVPPDAKLENIQAVVEAVQNFV